jgi:hypothetical protein
VQNHDGFTTISEEAFIEYFANGVPHEKAEVLYAVQQPTAATLFAGRTTVAAWQTKPSWYAVSKRDQTISRHSRPSRDRCRARSCVRGLGAVD